LNILGIFLNNQLRTGGNKRYLALMEELALRGNSVCVVMNSFLDYSPKYFKKVLLSVQYKRKGFPPASYLFRKSVKKEIEIIKTDFFDFILIFGDTHLNTALLLRKSLRIPLFYGFRANDIDRARILRKHGGLNIKEFLFSLAYEPINRRREKKVARFAELITFQNSLDRDIFLKRTGCAASKTVIIPGNIGSWCLSEWRDKNNSFRLEKILYVGLLSASKGLRELLKALGQLKAKGYGFLKCYVLGRLENTGPVLELIRKLDIEDMVSLEGFQNPFPYLADCDLMVYPTLYDAFPNTVLESLHAGCPVMASAAGGLPDLLHYPELLFESGNVRQIADKIERCIKEPSFYAHIRKLCSERAAVHRFDWAKQFETAMKEYIINHKEKFAE
jgi:glycosyltransferase involved in cell wall biosynthesis